MDKLKDCPFCGSETKVFETMTQYKVNTFYEVRCVNEKCMMSSGFDWVHNDKESAIKEWNSEIKVDFKSQLSQLEARIKELEEENGGLIRRIEIMEHNKRSKNRAIKMCIKDWSKEKLALEEKLQKAEKERDQKNKVIEEAFEYLKAEIDRLKSVKGDCDKPSDKLVFQAVIVLLKNQLEHIESLDKLNKLDEL